MKLFAATLALWAGGVLADYTTVAADINKLSNALTNLDNDVNAYVGGIVGLPDALQVQLDAVNIDNELIQATSDANASPPFGNAGSFNISTMLVALEPKITNTLNDVKNKNSTFTYFRPIVLASLYQLKEDTDTFSAAVIKKLEPAEASVAPIIVSQIDSAFNSAIQTYGGTPQ